MYDCFTYAQIHAGVFIYLFRTASMPRPGLNNLLHFLSRLQRWYNLNCFYWYIEFGGLK